MYDSENWFLSRSDKRKIEAAEMRFLRPMAGYTLSGGEKSSSDISEQMGTFIINDKLTQYAINWREHIGYKEWMTTDYPKKCKLQI
jgi:hypothetical protein